jgi:hypothetical protein
MLELIFLILVVKTIQFRAARGRRPNGRIEGIPGGGHRKQP